MKKTKIVCTLGPACTRAKVLKKMITAGMNAARINISHGKLKQHLHMISLVKKTGEIPTIIDSQGPEIRIRCDRDYPVNKNEKIVTGFTADDQIRFDHDFYRQIKKGSKILIEDGSVATRVEQKTKHRLVLKALNQGTIRNGKGVNVPSIQLKMPSLSEKDKQIIPECLNRGAEYVALSFTRDKNDVLYAKKTFKKQNPGIIAKIENSDGIDNFEKILPTTDGIMVARGDLGVEISSERVPLLQKGLIKKCNQAGIPVITATQMLESMLTNPRPTRAETSDVANAILDGTDAVMLSGETAVGKYPTEAVREMARIAREVETKTHNKVDMSDYLNPADAITKTAYQVAKRLPADRIVCVTQGGYTPKMISRFRPKKTVIAVTENKKVKKQLEIVWGVRPVWAEKIPQHDQLFFCAKLLLGKKILKKKDTIILAEIMKKERPGRGNLIQIHNIEDVLKAEKGQNS